MKDGLLGKYMVITPQKVKIKNSSKKFLPAQGGFLETACPKERQDRSWLGPCVTTKQVIHQLQSGQLVSIQY